MDEAPKSEASLADGKDETPSRLWRLMSRLKRLKGPIVAIAAVGTVLGGLAGYWNGWRTVRSGIAEVAVSPTKVAGPAAPYSAADRRMTFAVLPFHAPTGDADGARMALAALEVTQSEQEGNFMWARVAPRTLVEQRTTGPAPLDQLGQALDVHYLFHGNVTRSDAGYALELAVVDAATERVLDFRTIKADTAVGGAQLPSAAIREATHWLTYAALKQEVARVRDKPDGQLDVRDLTFRAYVDWHSENPDRASVYATAMQSLSRALALAPDDLLGLRITAQVNLCECLKTWAIDTSRMERVGIAALDKYLALQPDSLDMLALRFWVYFKRGQYEEALMVNDRMLAKDPTDWAVLYQRVVALRSSGEVDQALALVPTMLKAQDDPSTNAVAAEVYFAHGDDALAARLARKALVLMTRAQLADSDEGHVALVLVAAESRAGHLDKARRAFKDFQEAVPNVKTVSQIKAWLQPFWVAPGGDAFWEALQRAGAGS